MSPLSSEALTFSLDAPAAQFVVTFFVRVKCSLTSPLKSWSWKVFLPPNDLGPWGIEKMKEGIDEGRGRPVNRTLEVACQKQKQRDLKFSLRDSHNGPYRVE